MKQVLRCQPTPERDAHQVDACLEPERIEEPVEPAGSVVDRLDGPRAHTASVVVDRVNRVDAEILRQRLDQRYPAGRGSATRRQQDQRAPVDWAAQANEGVAIVCVNGPGL